MTHIKFLADVHLGRVAKYLRAPLKTIYSS